MTACRTQNQYDHRFRELVYETQEGGIALESGVPKSTVSGWLKREPPKVITLDIFDMDAKALQREVVKLRRRVRVVGAVVGLLVSLIRILGGGLDRRRFRDDAKKRSVLRAVERSRAVLPLGSILLVLGLSSARYHKWARGQRDCGLEGAAVCPRRAPNQLTVAELAEMKSFVTSPEYRHVPMNRLALLAQRAGKVFASTSTWYRASRLHRWRRPRLRAHPKRPKVGLRTSKPDAAWHIDTTIIRLLDGTKVYLHGVIDNYSRRILGWHLARALSATSSVTVLCQAIAAQVRTKDAAPPDLYVGGGSENLNALVDAIINTSALRRVLAQTDVHYSNSKIEAFWHSAKNQWLYLNTLDTFETVERLVAFYVEEHNSKMPLPKFGGRTPDEVYRGERAELPEELADARAGARLARLDANRATSCFLCERGLPVSRVAEPQPQMSAHGG